MGLYDQQGHRLYLTAEERAAFLTAAKESPRDVRTFCTVLHDTGCRISEALNLTAGHVDFAGRALIFETLKKRRPGIYRAVPVPADTLDMLDLVHGIKEHQKRQQLDARPWSWHRATGWRRVKAVMDGDFKRGVSHPFREHVQRDAFANGMNAEAMP